MQHSQRVRFDSEKHWGILIPCGSGLEPIILSKSQRAYTIGRDNRINDIILCEPMISRKHCEITWDGLTAGSIVKVQDYSKTGTFINSELCGGIGNKNKFMILRDGNEIGFGSIQSSASGGGCHFIFRHSILRAVRSSVGKHYEFGAHLGKGSFGTVMKAVDMQNGFVYAAKQIHFSSFVPPDIPLTMARKGTLLRRLFYEVKTMQKVGRHPNVCQLKEAFCDDEHIYLILEYMPGGDLFSYLERHDGSLTEDHTKIIIRQVCIAMVYIHSQGVIHRDLKPENILLSTSEPPQIKIGDFGLAKVINETTMLKTICGTLAYRAPEIGLNTDGETYSHTVDSWSVGVIAFTLPTGHFPYNSEILKAESKPVIDWQTLRDVSVSKPCIAFIRGLLRHAPEKRMSMEKALKHAWLKSVNVQIHGQQVDPPESDQEELEVSGKARQRKPLVRRIHAIERRKLAALQKEDSVPHISRHGAPRPRPRLALAEHSAPGLDNVFTMPVSVSDVELHYCTTEVESDVESDTEWI